MRRHLPDKDVLVGVRILMTEQMNVFVNVDGWTVDWKVSRRKTPSVRFYSPPSPSLLPIGKTHLMRRRESRRGEVVWKFVEKEARTAIRTGQQRLPLPPPPQPSSALVVAPAARFASAQFLFPGLEGVEKLPRHIGWA